MALCRWTRRAGPRRWLPRSPLEGSVRGGCSSGAFPPRSSYRGRRPRSPLRGPMPMPGTSALLVALALFLAPGRLAEIASPNIAPKPGERVSLAEYDRKGQPRPFLVAVDRETFAAVDVHKLEPLSKAWEDGSAWYVESPMAPCSACCRSRPTTMANRTTPTPPALGRSSWSDWSAGPTTMRSSSWPRRRSCGREARRAARARQRLGRPAIQSGHTTLVRGRPSSDTPDAGGGPAGRPSR